MGISHGEKILCGSEIHRWSQAFWPCGSVSYTPLAPGNAGSNVSTCDGGATSLPCHTISIFVMSIGDAPQFSTCSSQLRMIGSPPGPATGSPVIGLRITAPFVLSPQLRFELNVQMKGLAEMLPAGSIVNCGLDNT